MLDLTTKDQDKKNYDTKLNCGYLLMQPENQSKLEMKCPGQRF